MIDDQADIRDFMTAALEGSGYEVRTAADGAEALRLQRHDAADLVITDIFMPGQDGFETITQFRAEFPQARIVVMSAGTLPGLDHDFLATAALLGVRATLRKPFSADQLLDTVRSVLPPR